jgi:hypothetical protein
VTDSLLQVRAQLEVLNVLVARLYDSSFQARDLSLPEINAELAAMSGVLTHRSQNGETEETRALEDAATVALDNILQLSLMRLVG